MSKNFKYRSKYPGVLMKDWLRFHPYQAPVPSDYFYLRVCNEVQAVLYSVEDIKGILKISKDEITELSCMLTAWFEDLISESRIYQAFVEQHYKLYTKYLPFYSYDEYFPGEIHQIDVQFLIWYFLSKKHFHQILISPESNLVEYFGFNIFEIFDNHWEIAPENPAMKKFLQISLSEADFYTIRYKIDWLVLNSYLFFFYGDDCTKDKIEILKKRDEGTEFEMSYLINLTQEVHDDYVHNTVTSLLGFTGKQWLAFVLGENHPLHKPLLQLSNKKSGMFLYLGKDDKSLFFRHIASGYELKVTRKSMKMDSTVIEGKLALNIGFVQWMNEWWFSGIYVQSEMNDEILLEETSNPYKADLFADVDEKMKLNREMYANFVKYNHQKPIAFLKNKHELNQLINDFFVFHNNEMAKANPEAAKKFNKQPKNKLVTPLQDDEDMVDNGEGLLFFFSSTSGIEIAHGINQIIPDKENVFYDPDHEDQDAMNLLAEPTYSHELVKYLTENYQLKNLKLNGQKTANLIKDNLDFISRFQRRKSYYPTPRFSMV